MQFPLKYYSTDKIRFTKYACCFYLVISLLLLPPMFIVPDWHARPKACIPGLVWTFEYRVANYSAIALFSIVTIAFYLAMEICSWWNLRRLRAVLVPIY